MFGPGATATVTATRAGPDGSPGLGPERVRHKRWTHSYAARSTNRPAHATPLTDVPAAPQGGELRVSLEGADDLVAEASSLGTGIRPECPPPKTTGKSVTCQPFESRQADGAGDRVCRGRWRFMPPPTVTERVNLELVRWVRARDDCHSLHCRGPRVGHALARMQREVEDRSTLARRSDPCR